MVRAEVSPQRVRFLVNGNEHVLAPIFAANISVMPSVSEPEVEVSNDEPLHHLKPERERNRHRTVTRCRGVERRRMLDLGIVPGTVVSEKFPVPVGT